MASSTPASPDAGYATPLAIGVSLAMALIATALVQRSSALLALSRNDLTRDQLAAVLDGAQLQAAAAVVRTGAGPRFRWALSTDAGWVEAVAESEATKVDLASAANLDDRVFEAMEVADIPILRAKLSQAASGQPMVDVGVLDDAPLWRACAANLISSFGNQTHLQALSPATPHMGDLTPDWRVSEVWRLQLTTDAGWRDERIVRFTGDAFHPTATVLRRMSRGNGGQGICDAVSAALSAATTATH